MDTIRIGWILPDRADGEPAYFINGTPIGSGEAGFEAILAEVKRDALSAVVLELGPLAGAGGKSVRAMLPFAARYAEFAEALGGRDATLEMR